MGWRSEEEQAGAPKFEGQLVVTPGVHERFSWEQIMAALQVARQRAGRGDHDRVQVMNLGGVEVWVSDDNGMVTIMLAEEC